MEFLNKNINEAKYNQPHTPLELKSNAAPRLFSLIVVVYHLHKVSGKSGWKVNGTHMFESFRRKISGSNRTSEKVVLFSGRNVPNRNSCSLSSRPSSVPVSGSHGQLICKFNNNQGESKGHSRAEYRYLWMCILSYAHRRSCYES